MTTPPAASTPRYDALDKATGQAMYTEDLPIPPGTVFGRVLLSPYSHALIRSINVTQAEQLPGVLAVLTRDHLGDLAPYPRNLGVESGVGRLSGGPGQPHQPFIATDKVRFDGEPVAAVAAETLAIADHAIQLIDVEYEELPPVFDPRDAVKPDAPLLHEDSGSNTFGEYNLGWGDVEQGFQESDHVFEDTYVFQNVFHHPMENVGTCLAQFVSEEITLTAPIQHIFSAREELAVIFGLAPEKVRITMPYVGGGFGAKELKPAMICALWLALHTGRTIKMMPTARESFRTDARHAVVYRAKTGVKADGTLVALEVDALVDAGAYATVSTGTARMVALSSWGPYRIPNLKVRSTAVYTNKVPAGSFRGVGKAQSTWGCESNIDSVARQIGVDPVDLRLKNILQHGEEFVSGAIPLDSDFPDMIERAAAAIDWDGRAGSVAPPSSATPETGSNIVRGRGLAVSLRHGHAGGGRTYATVTLDRTGTVTVHHNGPEIGEGIYTVMARVASATLGISQGHVRVDDPDSTTNPFFVGLSSQRATVCLGNAAQAACEDLKAELIDVAAKTRGGTPEDWRLEGGRLWHGEDDFSFGDIVGGLGSNAVLMGKGAHTTARADNIFGIQMPHWGTSAAAAEVEVDTETGEVRLVKFATVVDVGKALNPRGTVAQAEGGTIMGLGHTLFEECVYSEGQFLNGDDMQYRLPLMEDLPEWWRTVMVENEDGPGPMGSKGMAQTSIVVVAPAIANAIYDATGVRIRDLPINPEKVLKALGRL